VSVGIGLGPRTGVEKPADGDGESGFTDRFTPLLASDLALQDGLLTPSAYSQEIGAGGGRQA